MKRFLTALTLIMTVSWCHAATLQVPTDYDTIQAAIDASEDGDSIVIQPGHYTENLLIEGLDIILTSTDPTDPSVVAATVVDGQEMGTVIIITNGSTATVTGLTITGGTGTADPEAPEDYYLAGGIMVSHSSPIISHNRITENRIPEEVVIPGQGGRDTRIEVTGIGGGIGCYFSQATIQDNEIFNNKASFGGGIYCGQGAAEVHRNVFYGNQALHGAAVLTEFDQAVLGNNLVHHNQATGVAGGFAIIAGATVVNNTLVANSSDQGGSQVYSETTLEGVGLIMINNILCQSSNNYGGMFYGQHPHDLFVNNNAWDNQPDDYYGLAPLNESDNNLFIDPGFVDAASRDYHLSAGSACIDRGTSAYGEVDLTLDLDGGARLVADGIDLGADEYAMPRLIARAGDFQTLSRLGEVTLDGTASSFVSTDGTHRYQWTQTSGPHVTLNDATSATCSFTATEWGQYRFALTVSDSDRASAPTETWVTFTNHAPVACLAPTQSTLETPVEITLDGTPSYDPDQDPLTIYQWAQLEGPTVSLIPVDQGTVSFTATEAGNYRFSLVVNDGLAESDAVTQTVVVGNSLPVADAGLTHYVHEDPITLSGLNSYDPDGLLTVDLSFHWRQISGPTLSLDDPNSPTPVLSGMQPNNTIQHCLFELVVNDGQNDSDPATVEVVIVEDYGNQELRLINSPFDVTKPTIVVFEGGDCDTGSGWYRFTNTVWSQNANIMTNSYQLPHYVYGDHLMVYLSEVAPNYDQPIQTMGFSTGGMICSDIAIRANCVYGDPRYAVNRVTYLDAGCTGVYNYPEAVWRLRNENLTGETCWIDHYYSNSGFLRDTLAVRFAVPPAGHGTPPDWVSESYHSAEWPNGFFNDGIYGGFYVSLSGPAKNLVLAEDTSPYLFNWISSDPHYLEPYDSDLYPGRLPEPVTLVGPTDPGDANGVLLSCLPSRQAVGYELLIGIHPTDVPSYQVLSDTPEPPSLVLTELPFESGYWTVRVRDLYGSTQHADPLPLYRSSLQWPIENQRTLERYTSLQAAIDDARKRDVLVLQPGIYPEHIDFVGQTITLQSTDPEDAGIVASTVLYGPDASYPLVTFSGGEKDDARLSGLTLIGGQSSLSCSDADGTLDHCLLLKSQSDGLQIYNGSVTLSHCTISDHLQAGIAMSHAGRNLSKVELDHCILANNGTYGLTGDEAELDHCTLTENRIAGLADMTVEMSNSIVALNGQASVINAELTARYSCIEGGHSGTGNIDVDPGFVALRQDRPGALWDGQQLHMRADYHLTSQAGHWDPDSQNWVQDAQTSACIDAADPAADFSQEVSPHGSRANLGAYGNTPSASRTF